MTKIRLISFDLDDTLWDAEPVLRRAEQAQFDWLAAHCPRVTARYDIQSLYALRVEFARQNPQIQYNFTLIRRRFFAILLRTFGYDDALAGELVEHFLATRSEVMLFPGVAPLLRALAKDFMLAAMTNGNTDLKRAGLDHLFQITVSPQQTAASKPDVKMFEYLFRRASVSAAEVVHVGDQPFYDIEAAHRAGVASVWLNRAGVEWPHGHVPATVEISSLSQLPDALKAIANLQSEAP